MQKDRIGGGAEIEKLRADNAALTEKYRKEKENSAKSQVSLCSIILFLNLCFIVW